jgi:hypothetical protein
MQKNILFLYYMNKIIFTAFVSVSFSAVCAQQHYLAFKRSNKVIERFWKGSTIAFQLYNKEWQKGEITKISNDSFYIMPVVIKYHLMGADTIRYNIAGFSIADVYAFPKKGILIDYINGRFQISRAGGHVHFFWIKSGWLFRTGAIGYAVLNIINGLLRNDFSFDENRTQLGIAAGVFLGGVLLRKMYTPVLRLGEKYHIETLKLAD